MIICHFFSYYNFTYIIYNITDEDKCVLDYSVNVTNKVGGLQNRLNEHGDTLKSVAFCYEVFTDLQKYLVKEISQLKNKISSETNLIARQRYFVGKKRSF